MQFANSKRGKNELEPILTSHIKNLQCLLMEQTSLVQLDIFYIYLYYPPASPVRVDTHIDRVSNRTKFAMGKNVVEVNKSLKK